MPAVTGSGRRAAAAGLAVAVLAACGGHGGPINRRGSRLGGPGRMPPKPEPLAYRVVYRVEEPERPAGTRTAEIVRPFRGRQEIGQAGHVEQLLVSDFSRSATTDGSNPTVELAIPPSPAVGDVRSAAIADAVATGRLVVRERRMVIDRPCQVYRSAVAVGLVLRPLATRAKDWTDICLDAEGLPLETVAVAGGKAVHREVAVEVLVGQPPDEADAFTIAGPLLGVAQGGGVVRRVDPVSSPPGIFYDATPPTGFTLLGRYAVIPPQPSSFSSQDPNQQASRLGSVDDVFVSGPDMITVERGGTLGGVAPYGEEPGAVPVDLAGLGGGEELLSLGVSEVRARTGGGHFVRVIGTVAPEVLVGMARGLRPVPGTSLRFLDPAPDQK